MIQKLGLTVLALGLALSTATPAQSADAQWQVRNMTFTPYGLGIKNEYRNKPIAIEILYSDSKMPGDVAFVCTQGSLLSRVSVEPGDLYTMIYQNLGETYEAKTNPRRTFRPVILIDGDKAKKTKWVEGPTDRMVMPIDPTVTRQLYNAVIKGQSVNFQRGSKVKLDLTLPPLNDNFRYFGENCGIGKNAKR